MRSRLRGPLAAAFGLMLVTTAVLGGALMQPGVDDLDDAATTAGFGTAEAASFWSIADKMAATGGGINILGLFDDSSVDEDELAGLDATETKKEIYTQAGTQKQNNENILTAYGNYLNDTESIALMEGKNAYIRALENGSSEFAARTAATDAVADYYATKQQNIVAAWNTSATVWSSSVDTAQNTSNVSEQFVWLSDPVGASYSVTGVSGSANTSDYTLVNGSTAKPLSIEYTVNSDQQRVQSPWYMADDNPETTYTEAFIVEPPNDNHEKVVVADFSDFSNMTTEIESQNADVQAELDTFVNNTFDSYVKGEINTTDLVDPYLGSREYSPETGFQTWALSSVLSMGLDGPENLSNVGKMVVTDHTVSQTYEGIVLTDENPDGGLTVGTTYNASVLNGTQMVVTSSTVRELEGQFTLESAVSSDGAEYAANESVTYKTVNYQTANTTEFKALMSEMTQLQKELNQKQQEERSGAGGSSLDNTQKVIALLAVAGLALLVGNRS